MQAEETLQPRYAYHLQICNADTTKINNVCGEHQVLNRNPGTLALI